MTDGLLFACNAILPILFLIGLGYFLRHTGLLKEDVVGALNRLCFRVFIPVLLFRNIYNGGNITGDDLKVLLFAAGMILLIFLIGLPIVRLTVSDNARRGVLLQAAFRSNYAVLGLQLAGSIAGEEGARLASLLTMVSIPMFNALGVVALSLHDTRTGKRPSAGRILRSIVTNPLILGVLAGILALGVRALLVRWGWSFRLTSLPGVYDAIDKTAQIATPLALIALGGQFKLSSARKMAKPIAAGTAVRLLAVPVTALLLASLLPQISAAEYACIFALFAAPVAVSSSVMAGEMGGDGELAGQLVVWSTLFSAVTIFVMLTLLRILGIL